MTAPDTGHATTRALIWGATGHIGKELIQAVLARPDMQLAGGTASSASPWIGKDLGLLCNLPETGTKLSEGPPNDWDFLIDFSLPASNLSSLDAALAQGKPAIIGTTGLSKLQFKRMEQAALQVPVLFAANFSLGMALLLKHAAALVDASRAFHARLSMSETHQIGKKDAPSGTALALAEQLNLPTNAIKSIRQPEFAGVHRIECKLSENEEIHIEHRITSRSVFAHGALEAATWLMQQPAGKLYGLHDLQQLPQSGL
ncbi:MAG: 4-hydroxy-tetrahydrodipicolinate reductase [Gammaproteobacteria bacterium]